jgi:hypothetical protein
MSSTEYRVSQVSSPVTIRSASHQVHTRTRSPQISIPTRSVRPSIAIRHQSPHSTPVIHQPSRASSPGRLIVVYGYGCDVFQKSIKERSAHLQSVKHPSFGTVDVYCNDKEPRSMTYDIWKTLVRRGIVLEPTPFVKKIIDEVCASLRRKERVTLVGHSYGGSVVSRVAMYLSTRCSNVDTSLLRIKTYGSIFIPPPEKTHGISIKHIVYSNDIAKLCHKTPTSCPKQGNVHVLYPRKWDPIRSHMNYDDMISDVAKKGIR